MAAGPLAAELGEVAGHMAGDVAGDLKATLVKAGLPESEAERWRAQIESGDAILLGAHARRVDSRRVEAALIETQRGPGHSRREWRRRLEWRGVDGSRESETGRFTVGRVSGHRMGGEGRRALRKQGLAVESLSILGKASPEMAAFIERTLGAPQSLEMHDLGPAMARGPLVAALQGSDQGLTKAGIAGTMRRVGFQAHDGRIFHVLTGRGGVHGGDSQRAAGRRCAGGAALLRWRQRRDWRLDRTGLRFRFSVRSVRRAPEPEPEPVVPFCNLQPRQRGRKIGFRVRLRPIPKT